MVNPSGTMFLTQKTNEVNSYLLFSLNGVNVSGIKGTETEIEEGSELLILSATGGG